MEDKIITLPVIIKHTKDSDYPYFARIPDIDGMTAGKDITDAKNMAMDYIGTYSLVHDLPKSNTTLPKEIDKNDITTLVTVNISEYRRKTSSLNKQKMLNTKFQVLSIFFIFDFYSLVSLQINSNTIA